MLREIDGVVSVRNPDDRPHLTLVEYNPARTDSQALLTTVTAAGVHAELIGLWSIRKARLSAPRGLAGQTPGRSTDTCQDGRHRGIHGPIALGCNSRPACAERSDAPPRYGLDRTHDICSINCLELLNSRVPSSLAIWQQSVPRGSPIRASENTVVAGLLLPMSVIPINQWVDILEGSIVLSRDIKAAPFV